MLAARLHRFDGLSDLVLEEIPQPQPAADELLVRVRAASVNPADVLISEGRFPRVTARDLPLDLGSDVAGTVVACGTSMHEFAQGDAVYGKTRIGDGAFAEYALLNRDAVARAPANIDLAVTAAIPLAALTALQGLFEHGGLVRGQRVAIVGAAGGVGHFAVQMARIAGAMIVAVASQRDLAFVRMLGAHEVLARDEDPGERLTGIDLVLDLVGGPSQDRWWPTLAPNGAIVSPTRLPDETLRTAPGQSGRRYICRANRDDLERITNWVEAGELAVTIAARYPLGDITAALNRIKHGGLQGKILVDVARD
ncbi:MAG: zinc-binding dehydrogenase family protein [Bradyrhizobium sp.]|nr:zinc-binding dehydrogenase family protein [Bradyrhizobium sp.]